MRSGARLTHRWQGSVRVTECWGAEARNRKPKEKAVIALSAARAEM